MGFLNRTGAEIGYKLDEKCKEIIKKYRECPALPGRMCRCTTSGLSFGAHPCVEFAHIRVHAVARHKADFLKTF